MCSMSGLVMANLKGWIMIASDQSQNGRQCSYWLIPETWQESCVHVNLAFNMAVVKFIAIDFVFSFLDSNSIAVVSWKGSIAV